MKRHISIFAFLLSVFAAVGSAAGAIQRALVVSTLQDCVEKLSLTTGGPGGSYYSLGGAPLTAKELTGYRFLGWYTTPSDCDFTTATPANCTALLTTSLTISSVDGARICTVISDTRHPLLCPKFQKTYAITTAVSPTDAGTVIISGTNGVGAVDAGGSVTLTATAKTGYEFSKWSDDVTDNPRTISNIKSDATYTAVFTAKVNAITSGPTIANWTYGDTPKAPSAQAKYTGSTGMTYTYYDSSKASLGSSPPTNAGTYYIRATSPSSAEYVSATSDYVQFSISKKTINTDGVSFPNKSVTYTGGEQKIEASNVPSGVTVTYENDTRTAVGEQTATVNFAPADVANCLVTTTSKTAKLTITAAQITGVMLKSTSVTYDGQPHQPQIVSVTANGKTFTSSDTGWKVVYQRDSVETSDFTTAGTITVKVTGTGNLTGSSSAYFTIGKKEIRMDEVVFADLTVTYDGTEKTIEASNVPSGVTVTYSSNTRTTVGQQQARVTFEPNDKNHTVSLTQKLATLKIEQATITEVALNGTSATYDGQSHKPTIGWVTANNRTFQNVNTGWDVTYLRNGAATGDFTSPGTITVKATGTSNLKGAASATFTINKAMIESVTLATVSATYDGKPHQPVVNSVTASGKGFSSPNAGWTVAYTRGGAATTDFTSAGTITVTVTGKDGLSGTASATFTIAKKTISTTGVGFSDKSVTYDGTPKSITASSIPEGVKATYSNNSRTDAGSQKTTVNFEPTDKENCEVSPTSKTATLTVNPATISGVTLASTSVTYDGQPHQPQVVSVTANGKMFTDAAIGWDVAYDKTDFTSVGTIKVTANGKKNLTGSANATFEIKSKSITVTFDPNGGNAPSPASKTVQYPGTYGTLATCTRKGYDLKGWWTAEEGGTQITETTSVESTANQTLYAHWEAKKYTLTLALKEGESYGVYKGPQNYQLPDPLIFGETNLNEIAVAYNKDDADFQGYFTSAGAMVYDAQGRNVMGALGEYWTNNYPIGTYCYDGNLTLSARFADPREHYQVVVKASPEETGTVSPAGTNTFVEGSNVVLTATANTGYSFCCWSNDNKVVSTTTNYQLKVTANAEYVAVFTGNVYKVVFYDKLSWTPQNVFVTFGSNWPETPKPKWDGYDFLGWFTDPEEGQKVEVQGRVSAKPPSPLYAHWGEKTTATVTFVDPIGIHSATGEYDKNKEIGAAPEETQGKDWQHFDDGYWQDPNDKWYPPLTTIVTGDMTVKAKWLSVADVLDCEGTLWFAIDDNSAWFVDSTDCKQGGTSLRADGPRAGGSGRLTTSVSEPGTMTFWRKGDAGTVLSVKSGTETWFFSGSAGMDWTPCTITITNKEPSSVIFYCAETGGFAGRCSVDCFTWTPGIEHTVTFHDPSGTFPDEGKTVDEGQGATAPSWISDKFDPTTCGWDKDFSKVMEDITVNAVWTCRVEFVDGEGGNPPVTNKVGYGQAVAAPTTFTPPADKHFGGWNPSLPDAIESNSVFTVVWTDNPTYTVTYSWDKTQTDTKRQGVPLTLKGAIFTRAGYEQDGWSKNPDGFVKDFELGPVGIYSDDADLTLYPTWKELKPVVVDEIARALDCEDSGLTFEATGGWSVFTNESFAQEGPSCLSNTVNAATLTTTITESGTLTFWWKAKYHPSLNFLCTTNNKEVTKFTMRSQDQEMWRSAELPINASQGDVTLVFRAQNSGYYTALDHFTWTPDGKKPEYADTDTSVTGFSMADGKLGFSFVGDGSTYHLLGTNDLVAPMPWPMVFETNKASGTILFDIPVKADEPKMFYRIRALQE